MGPVIVLFPWNMYIADDPVDRTPRTDHTSESMRSRIISPEYRIVPVWAALENVNPDADIFAVAMLDVANVLAEPV